MRTVNDGSFTGRCVRSTDCSRTTESALPRGRASFFRLKQNGQRRNDSALAGRAQVARLSSPKDAATLTEHDSEVNKMSYPNPVLFECSPISPDHRQTVELLCKPKDPPEGGPWCICSRKAISALQAGAPICCDELPWSCPFTSQITSTPTT